jgi:hypothetical protein
MSNFVFVYRIGQKVPTEHQKEQLGHWMSWLKELENKGVLVAAGEGLEPLGKIVKGSGATRSVVEGTFADVKDSVGGYSIVKAKDLDHAVELTTGCPVLAFGGGVEVRPVMAR